MLTISEINNNAKHLMFEDMKVPNGVSNPVLRVENGVTYIAYFGYTFGKKNLEEKRYKRPSRWLLVDIESGELVRRFDCNNKDFSNESIEKLYSMEDANVKIPNANFFSVMDTLFDTARASIVFGNKLDEMTYKAYLRNLYAITPLEYIVFYKNLCNEGGATR